MSILYISDACSVGTHEMILRTARLYAMEIGIKIGNDPMIGRTDAGKPFFIDVPELCFSVSHSGDFIACLMSDRIVGLDIQEIRKINSKAVADRYFTIDEQRYVQAHGDRGFYDIWTMKEAIAKYVGTTLARIISNINVIVDDKPVMQMPTAELHIAGELPAGTGVCTEQAYIKKAKISEKKSAKQYICTYVNKNGEEAEIRWI